MFKEFMFRFSYYWMKIEIWWDDLWMSDIKKSRNKRIPEKTKRNWRLFNVEAIP